MYDTLGELTCHTARERCRRWSAAFSILPVPFFNLTTQHRERHPLGGPLSEGRRRTRLDCTGTGLQPNRPSSFTSTFTSLHLTFIFHPNIQSPGASPHLVSPLRIKYHLPTAAGPRSSVPHPSHPGQSQSRPTTTIATTALEAITIADLHNSNPTRYHLGAHALIDFCRTTLTHPLVYIAHAYLS
jgi:hypothetical protein